MTTQGTTVTGTFTGASGGPVFWRASRPVRVGGVVVLWSVDNDRTTRFITAHPTS